jgi:hypothetical protein
MNNYEIPRLEGRLVRLEFVYEGTLRSFQVRPDGSRRDTVYFSLLAEEWPAARRHLDELITARGALGGAGIG